MRRISVGSALARTALHRLSSPPPREIAEYGTFARLADLPHNAAVNEIFAR